MFGGRFPLERSAIVNKRHRLKAFVPSLVHLTHLETGLKRHRFEPSEVDGMATSGYLLNKKHAK